MEAEFILSFMFCLSVLLHAQIKVGELYTKQCNELLKAVRTRASKAVQTGKACTGTQEVVREQLEAIPVLVLKKGKSCLSR